MLRLRALVVVVIAALWLVGSAAGPQAEAPWPVAGPEVVLAASPSPTPAVGGDPRSTGEGPGFVGAPLLSILVVLALGVGTAVATVLYVRLTGGPRNRSRPPR